MSKALAFGIAASFGWVLVDLLSFAMGRYVCLSWATFDGKAVQSSNFADLIISNSDIHSKFSLGVAQICIALAATAIIVLLGF
jgi:hypothetical protein